MSTLNSFAKKFQEKGGHVVTISEDNNNVEKVQGYYTQHKYENLPIFLDENGSLMGALGSNGLPTAIFFNAKGQEMGRIVAGIDWESAEIQGIVKSYLGIQVSASPEK